MYGAWEGRRLSRGAPGQPHQPDDDERPESADYIQSARSKWVPPSRPHAPRRAAVGQPSDTKSSVSDQLLHLTVPSIIDHEVVAVVLNRG